MKAKSFEFEQFMWSASDHFYKPLLYKDPASIVIYFDFGFSVTPVRGISANVTRCFVSQVY